MKEAEVALARGALVQALLAPVQVPKQFAHVMAMRLEGWAQEDDYPEFERMARELYEKLGRVVPAMAGGVSKEVFHQYTREEVAEAAFELCDASAWHAIARPTQESLAAVKAAYKRLSAALAPAGDKEVHELMDRFDLTRAILLVNVVSLTEEGLNARTMSSPHVQVTRSEDAVTVNCEGREVWKPQFVDALCDLTGAELVRTDGTGTAEADTIALPNGTLVEVFSQLTNPRAVGRITVRAVLEPQVRARTGADGLPFPTEFG